MATPRKVHGYEDNSRLESAIGANNRARELLAGIAQVAVQDARVRSAIVALSFVLGRQSDDLHQMECIRLRSRNGGQA